MNFAAPGCGIEHHQVFCKRSGLRGHFAVHRKRHTGAIKNQAVVATHLVHINNRQLVAKCNRTQHIHPQRALVYGVRRSRNIDDDAGSLRSQLRYRVAVVASHCPEVLVVPHVFANRDAQFLVREAEHLLLRCGLKIARLVEHVVGRQQHFALLKHNSASAQQRRFVGHRFP